MDKSKPQQYQIDNGVKMPTLWWDLMSTGEDYRLGQELIKASGGTWLGGTNYVIKPNREIVHIPENESLRDWLEANGIAKGITPISICKNNEMTIDFNLKGSTIKLKVKKSGNYKFKIFSIIGREVFTSQKTKYATGEYQYKLNRNLSSGQYIIKIFTNESFYSQRILIKN